MKQAIAFVAGFISCMLLVCAIGWLAAVRADDFLVATCCSYHFERKGYNERNYGLGLEHSISRDCRLLAGFYDNSLYRQTVYAGAVYAPLRTGQWHFGAVMGVFTGYAPQPEPLAAPVLMWEGEHLGVNLLVIPIPQGLVGAQLKWRFE